MTTAAPRDARAVQELRRARRRERDRFRSSCRRAPRASSAPTAPARPRFVNLVTGVLKPSAGRILLDGEDITQLPQARARAARPRPHLPDQPALPRPERARERLPGDRRAHGGVPATCFRPAGLEAASDRGGARASRGARACRRRAQAGARAGLRPPASGRDRDGAGAAIRKVLLLDEPAAGVPSAESGTHPRCASSASTRHRACSSSSTTWTWSSASRGASPCWCRGRAGRGLARGDRRRSARARGLSRRGRAARGSHG